MLKKRYQDYFGTKIYFTEADPSCQIAYSVSSSDFSVKLKLWLLLADHVILSTGHMLRSDITYRWLSENLKDVATLSADSAIVSSLSDKYTSFNDFVLDQVPDHSCDAGPMASHNPSERARLLSDIFRESITWSPTEESNMFSQMMSRHLRDSNSPLRKRMIGVRNATIRDVALAIEDTPDFNRSKLIEISRSLCPERQLVLIKYGNYFYYLSGALHKDAFPVMHNKAADLCREAVSYTAGDRQAVDSDDIWETITDNWGLSRRLLVNLSLKDIHEIREDRLGKRLRKTWGTLLKSAHEGVSYSDHVSHLVEAQISLKQLFKNELSKQERKHQRWQDINDVVQTGAWVTGGLGTLLGIFTSPIISAISFATGVIGFLSGPPIVGAIEKRQKGTELVILSDRVRRLSQAHEKSGGFRRTGV